MQSNRIRKVIASVVALVLLLALPLAAQEEEAEKELGWSNVTDLSLVVTDGNSSTETFGFKNRLERNWERASALLRVEAVRSNTADDPFALAEDPTNPDDVVVVRPDKTVDVEKYLVLGRYDRKITESFFWNVGASWDRNKDAGIINRYTGWAGVGNIWWDRDDLAFSTNYGLSYTDREEDVEDPEKDDRFAGVRFGWDYLNAWGKVTTFTNDWNINANISEFSDWTSDMTSAITVTMTEKIALRVSLQWLYNNQPALEEIDVIFIGPEGTEATIGTTTIRKKELDTVFSTSIVINL